MSKSYCALLLAALVVAAPSAPAQEDAADTNAAVVVDGNTLTRAELEKQVQERMDMFQGVPEASRGQVEQQVRSQIEEQFVTRTLLMKEAEERDITVSEGEVDEMLEQAKANLPEGMTLDQVLEMENLDEAGLRSELREQLTIKKLLDSVSSADVEVTDEEIATFYRENQDQMGKPETVKARHILVQLEPGDDEAARAEKKEKAEALRKRLADGESFAEVASAESDCPSSQAGGDLGEFPRGQMVKPFEEAAFSQEVDAIGPVVETQFGYHIIQVTARNEAQAVDLEEARPQIEQFLESRKRGEAQQTYLQKLRDEADVKYPGR